MAEKNKLFSKHDYLNDFKMNEKGEYVYTGSLHSLDESKVNLSDTKKVIGVYSSIIFIMFLLSGLIKADGLINTTYVTLPYVFGFIFACILLYKSLSYSFSKRYPIRDYDFKSTIEKLPIYIMIVLISSIATLIGELVFIIVNGLNNYIVGTIIFILCMGIVIFISTTFKRYNDTLIWKESKSNSVSKSVK